MTTRVVLVALLLSSSSSIGESHFQDLSSSNNEDRHPRRILLADGITECASCPNNDRLACSGTTVNDEFCRPCATGQLWWPCNIINECYCKDIAAAAAAAAAATAAAADTPLDATSTITTPTPPPPPCEIPLCQGGEYTLSKIVPFTNCTQWVSCTAGTPGVVQTCPPGQAYSSSISACNVLSLVTCVEDPPCPENEGEEGPTSSPVMTLLSIDDDNYVPSELDSNSSSSSSSSGNSNSNSNNGGMDVGGTGETGRGKINSFQPPMIDPIVIEGMFVIDAHMAANKIAFTRDLLTSSNSHYYDTYSSLKSSLHFMITIGAANRTFYIGQDNVSRGDKKMDSSSAAYGLVNIALFMAMSVEDSISRGSCDELNMNVVDGVLPYSNACGQFGVNYQDDMKCSETDSIYDCDVDMDMRVEANHPMSSRKSDISLPQPFFCGPKSDYGGNTGFWDYVNGVDSVDTAASEIGREDVEGCCWWGRGSLHLRGTCAYGKLNYFLGKRAADEGRPSLFPDIDFCRNPQAVCSDTRYPDLKWIAGLFRWITEIQSYNKEGFHFIRRLKEFTDGGLQDWSFVQGVSGIVMQGCHEPPCREGVAVMDGDERIMTFIKALKVFGLPVNDETIPYIKTNR